MMCKHQCLCGENQNHVEHGGRLHSIWSRLQEKGLVDMCERSAMRKASLDLLRLVHTPSKAFLLIVYFNVLSLCHLFRCFSYSVFEVRSVRDATQKFRSSMIFIHLSDQISI